MPRNRVPAPPRDPIAQDFTNALKRLIEGKPSHPKLIKAKAGNRLSITVSSVALEAGRSRTLIGYDGCRYPEIRRTILAAMAERPTEPRSLSEVITRLRADNATLRAERRAAMAEAVAHFHARKAAERETAKWKSAYERLIKKGVRQDDNVVEFSSPDRPK